MDNILELLCGEGAVRDTKKRQLPVFLETREMAVLQGLFGCVKINSGFMNAGKCRCPFYCGIFGKMRS